MDNIKISTTKKQQATSDELDAFAHDYLSVPLTIDDESIGCRAATIDMSGVEIESTDGVYSDTKEALEDVGVVVSGTEYQRIKDKEVLKVLLANFTHSDSNRFTPSELANIASFSSSVFNGNKFIRNFDEFEKFTKIIRCDQGFVNCVNLESIKFPDSFVTYGQTCNGCTNLKKARISPYTTSLGWKAFNACNSLEEINLPNTLTSMDSGVFSDCYKLALTELPDSITSIEERSFSNNYELQISRLPSSLIKLGTAVFANCKKITVDALPEGFTTLLGQQTFNGCTGITSMTFPSTLVKICLYCFMDCSNLKTVIFSNSVASIEQTAFYNCTSLEKVIFSTLEDLLNTIFAFGSSYYSYVTANPLYYAHHLYFADAPDTEVTSIAVPDGTTTIYPCFLAGGSNIESITIPDSLTTIGAGAFMGCSKITSLAIPDAVTPYDTNNIKCLFNGCTSLQKAILGDGITILSDHEFDNCPALQYSACLGVTETGGYIWYGTTNNCYVFLPKIQTWGALTIGTNLPLVDLGKDLTKVGGGYGAIHYSTVQYLIIRTTSVPTCTKLHVLATGGIGKYIFVPSDMISSYQSATNWSNYTNYFKAIGGTEWAEVFGSADEYADVAYIVSDSDDYSRIVNAYEN